jgi:uncharacterized protein (DUF433 family)
MEHTEATMNKTELLQRISVDPGVAGGKPCVRGTRIYIAIILDALAEGLTPEQVLDHYPQLTADDIKAALLYAGELESGAADGVEHLPHDAGSGGAAPRSR